MARSRFSLQFVGIMNVFFWANIPSLGTRTPIPTKFKVAVIRRKIPQNITICNIERNHLHSLSSLGSHIYPFWAYMSWDLRHISHLLWAYYVVFLPQNWGPWWYEYATLNPIRLLLLLSVFHAFSTGVPPSGGYWVLSVKNLEYYNSI